MKSQTAKKDKEIGGCDYININCWLAKNINRPPSKRCQYCELRFNKCLFSRYLLITLILAFFIFLIAFLVEKNLSKMLIASVLTLILAYGYFFNKSTETIVEASFAERTAKNDFKNLAGTLEQKVGEQTKELKERADHLEKLLQMRTEFLDIASHQLKTPISVIRATISMFEEGSMDKLPEAKRKEFFHNIAVRSDKLNSIIGDILRASEMDTEEFKIDSKTSSAESVEKIIKSIDDQLHIQANAKNIELVVEMPKQELPKVMTNIKFLEQAIYNLVDNAIKYTQKGFVKVILSQESGKIIIKISDSGIGIPLSDQKKVFDKFCRGANAVNMYADGSGLGLFIVKKIVEAHDGGQITMQSKENKGTTFTISLPAISGSIKSKKIISKNVKAVKKATIKV